MLESLTIKNYAIIEEMTAAFPCGLTVITGETGAGKSIVVDALELVLGARASLDMIRTGADALSVTAVFNMSGSPLASELPVEAEDNLIILRREVKTDGAGRCFINDQPVTLKLLKQTGDLLVDLHGQHEHQSLLNVDDHIRFLDRYAGCTEEARKVKLLFTRRRELQHNIEECETKIRNSSRERDFRLFQKQEIEQAQLMPGEDEELQSRIQKLSRAVELKTLGLDLFQGLSESEGSIIDRIGDIASRLAEWKRCDPDLDPLAGRLESVSIEIEDLADTFRNYAEKIEDDPATLLQLEERLAIVERMKKKYGPTVNDVLAFHASLERETEDTNRQEETLAALKEELVSVESHLLKAAAHLTDKEKKSGADSSGEVNSHLAELGMKGSGFLVDVSPFERHNAADDTTKMNAIGEDGFDRVEFMMSTNPGEPPKPMVKIASGGEISRVMLALKLALVHASYVPVMVFDEIDSGVSGRIAEAVGKKMLLLSRSFQVLTITHLPQIAAMGNCHYSARKHVKEGRTFTELVRLDDSDRERELASLVSGVTLSDTALAHAKRLMETVKDEQKQIDGNST